MQGKLNRWYTSVGAILGVALLVSCGGSGGVDSGGTGAVAQSYAAGPVTGLGSVIVSDVRFDDDTATILDEDGNALTPDDLRVGMLTRVDASAISNTASDQTAVALTVRVFSELKGSVDSVDPVASSLVVLGQTVRITAATWFDSALAGGLSAVSVGQVIEVYGQYNARTNQYFATRVVPRSGLSTYAIRGLLAAVDSTGKTLSVGGLTISYASIATNALPVLAVGEFVRIKVATQPSANTWIASSVALGRAPIPDRRDVRVVGRISAFTSSSQFELNGIPVDASSAAFPTGTSALVLGARVAVAGSASLGVLKASTVLVKGDENAANSVFELHGAITALNSSTQMLTVRGVNVHYSAQVQFSAGTLADLAVGRNILVLGPLTTDRTGIEAQTILFY